MAVLQIKLYIPFRLNDQQLLFEAVDETGVKGFNKDVLANIVAMYLKKGVEREDPTPHLAPYKVCMFVMYIFWYFH